MVITASFMLDPAFLMHIKIVFTQGRHPQMRWIATNTIVANVHQKPSGFFVGG